jgi:hypothetical protein
VMSLTTVILVRIRETAISAATATATGFLARPAIPVQLAVFAILTTEKMEAPANRVLVALTAFNAVCQKPARKHAMRRAQGRLSEVQVHVRWPQDTRETIGVGKPAMIIVVSQVRVTQVLTRQTAATEIQARLSNSSQTQIEIMMVALTGMIFFRLRSQSEVVELFSDSGRWQGWPPYPPMTYQRIVATTL